MQGWRSCESTRLPPMCPGFDSQTRRHMWVEFAGSLLCTERFFSGYSDFPLSSKSDIWFALICRFQFTVSPNRSFLNSHGWTRSNMKWRLTTPCEQSLLLSFSLLRRRKVGSARIASTVWSRRSPNFWTSQSCFLSSNRFFQCERPFFDKTDGYNWARCTMKNQDGGEIWHSRLGFETVSWQHAAHIQ